MNKTFITTFNRKLYEKYAYRLIETYSQTNQAIPIVVYVEDDINFYPKINNVIYKALFLEEPECAEFYERNKDRKVTNYLDDAVRFSYKVFAQINASVIAEKVFYIDSDCVFNKQIPMLWFDKCLPDNVFTSFYHRPHLYTETGFVAFNNMLPCANQFYRTYKNYYVQDTIYSIYSKNHQPQEGFTDCHAFDATREKTKLCVGYKEKHLGDHKDGHIMARDSFINDFIDHKKGDRKRLDRSPEWVKAKISDK